MSHLLEISVQSVLTGMLLVLGVSVLVRMTPRLTGSTRSLVWLATLIALPLIPVLYWTNQHSAPPPASPATATVRSSGADVLVRERSPDRSLPPRNEAPSIRPIPVAYSIDAPKVILTAYFTIATLLLLRLLAGYLRIVLLRRSARPAPAELQARLTNWLVRCPTGRPVALALTDKLRSPVAIGFRHPMILIPSALLLDLSEEELDNVGVHELAHIRRHDDWTNLFQQFLQAVLFFHPAIHYVARNLKFECEVACDDWVLSASPSKSYARCLTKVVELRGWQRAGVLSCGAFFSKAQILRRVELLLDKTRNTATGISGFTLSAIVLLGIGITLQVSRIPAVVSFSQDHGDSRSTVRWRDGEHDLRVNFRGDVKFSDDERSIASISPWGYVEIEESRGWSTRRIEVRPSSSGVLETKYFVDGHERPLDQAGRDWTAYTYPYLVRELGWDVEGRVERILARGGVSGVLNEIDLIHSGNVKGKYISTLISQSELTQDDLRRVASAIRKIPSDHEKAQILLANESQFTAAAARREYFHAVDSINSDNERKRVLVSALAAGGSSSENVQLVAHSASSMHSDNEKAAVLLAAPSGNATCELLRTAVTIHSDNEKARVLKNATSEEVSQCREPFFEAANQIHSDNEKSGVLRTLLQEPTLDASIYENIAATATRMPSDNEKANVLIALAPRYTGQLFFDAANTMHSDNERKRVLSKSIEGIPTKPALLGAVDSASRMNSDNEKAQILVAAARVSTDPEVRQAIQVACSRIHSDNEYRRVATALFTTN